MKNNLIIIIHFIDRKEHHNTKRILKIIPFRFDYTRMYVIDMSLHGVTQTSFKETNETMR